ncbi:MAG: glycosyltransferase [Ilumatobacteraceae bacterium]
METFALNVVLVGTYPPTECGLATYTSNLCAAIGETGATARVVRLVDAPESGELSGEVAALWVRSDAHGIEAVFPVLDECDVVMVQHEFGIYPGRDGDAIVELVRRCQRPVVTVLHTVLAHPSGHQADIVDALAKASRKLVVHSEAARWRLMSLHDLDPGAVAVIPHGASSNLTGTSTVRSPQPLLLTWGLLGPGKGVEHGIEAVAILHGQGFDVRYLISGETHPNVRAREGERYRETLVDLARERGVVDLVDFDPTYRDWPSLRAVVRSASLVLVPYDSRDQVTSGVLVEALAAGKPVVATAFPHAVELSHTGAVAVVDHEAPGQLACVIRGILSNSALYTLMEKAAWKEGARYDWAIVGQQFVALARDALQPPNLAVAM